MTPRPLEVERRRSGQGRASFLVLCVALALFPVCACGGSPTSPSPSSSQFDVSSFHQAGRITAAGGTQVLLQLRPGTMERDIKAILDSAFAFGGSGPLAFPHIVASGPNALDLHYPGDDRTLQGGELLLIDVGATFEEHCADMSRTFPASGRFTDRQRELYQLVLEAQMQVAKRIRPGADTLQTLHAAVRAVFQASPLRARDANGVERTMERFFIHGATHFVGRQVHGQDTGWSASAPLEVGQVLTIEPGLYIASEGIGIRIEDTYVVSARGLECLTCTCPKEIADVEARVSTLARPR